MYVCYVVLEEGYHNVWFLCRESRYILFLTENYAALDILKNPKNYLSDGLNISQEDSGDGPSSDVQPFILFGSSFPKDREYTQVSFLLKHSQRV